VTPKTQNTESRKFLTPARLFVLCALIAGIVAFFAFRLDRFVSLEALKTNREALTGWVAAHMVWAAVGYFVAYILAVALSLPVGAVMTLTGGFLFGPYLGMLLAIAGATAGATVLFLAARFVFGTALRARAGPWLRRMEAGFNKNAFSYLLALRLTPVFPFWIVNLVPAFLNVRTGTYVLATLIGVMPATVVFALIGHGLGTALDSGEPLSAALNGWVIAALAGLALLVLIPPAVRQLRARRKA
jgi:uncharacterized membrane protein YdjX (TVP38/TMEM64 family)